MPLTLTAMAMRRMVDTDFLSMLPIIELHGGCGSRAVLCHQRGRLLWHVCLPDGRKENVTDQKTLDLDANVSMNFLCFMPNIFQVLQEYLNDFLRKKAGNDSKAECLLPIKVDDLMKKERLVVSVLQF